MKKVKKGYMKKLCALVLTLCMAIGQTQGVWADELGSVSAAEATEVSAAADATAQAVEAEEITDEAASAAEEPEGITYQEQKIEELVQERALNAGETGDLFTYQHLDFEAINPEIGTLNYFYTGEERKPKFKVTWTPAPSSNEVSGNSTSGNAVSGNTVVLTEGEDYEITGYKDNTNIGMATVTFKGLGKYASKKTGSEPIEWWFFIVTNPDRVALTSTDTTVKVTNNHYSASENTISENTIYVALVSQNGVGEEGVTGIAVSANETVDIATYSYLDANGKVTHGKLQPETTYHAYACDYDDFPVAGMYMPLMGVADLGSITTKKADVGPGGVSTNLINGDEIKFAAKTQKDQSVKLSWSPAKDKGYKTYSVYRLKDGSTNINDDKSWDICTDNKNKEARDITKKAYTDNKNILKIGHNDARSGLYKLVAKNDSGKEDSYITVAAPWLFKTEGGYDKDTQDYYFTAHKESANLSYKLQTALNKNGFSDTERTVTVDSTNMVMDSYPVNKSLNVDSVDSVYKPAKESDKLSIGTKYFFRVQSVFTYGNLTVTSAPSNVLSRKAGPSKGFAYAVTGLTIQDYLEKVHGDPEIRKKIESGEDFYISGVHADSDGTCWKKGYVWFSIDSLDGVKEIQLLRATKADGKYSKAKSYPVSVLKQVDYDRLKKNLNLTDEQVAEYKEAFKNDYWIEYNNFVPEVTYFWAVRAVSSTGKVVGSFYPGVENKTVFEKVQDLFASDSGFGSIWLTWKHDDCAKQYWIYRAESKEDLKNQTKPVKKVNANKTETISGNKYNGVSDTTVQKGHSYYYMVRPVYKANKQGYEDFKGWVAETDTPVTATNDNAFCATVKTSVYSVKQVEVKWSGALKEKNKKMPVDQYQVEVYDGDTQVKTYPVTEKSAVKNRKYVVEVPVVGKTYTFKVKPVTDGQVGDKENLGGVAYCATHPLKVAGLKAAKQTGSAFVGGAKVTFRLNEKDQPYASGLSYVILSDNVMVDSGEFYDFYSKGAYIDSEYLSRGTWRNYKVYAVYTGPDKEGNPVGEAASVNYGKPNSVDLGDDKTLDADEEKTIEATFKCSGSRASVQDYDSVKSSDSDIVKVKSVTVEDGKVKIKLKAGNKSGSAKITIKGYHSGPSDSIKVTVRKKSSSSSSVWIGY